MPLKSLKRWIEIGPDRKKGGGRKVRDPEMERELFMWYLNCKQIGFYISPRMIKIKALSFTKNKDFNASKGWLAKFQSKYKLDLYTNKKKRQSKANGPLPCTRLIGNTYSSQKYDQTEDDHHSYSIKVESLSSQSCSDNNSDDSDTSFSVENSRLINSNYHYQDNLWSELNGKRRSSCVEENSQEYFDRIKSQEQ